MRPRPALALFVTVALAALSARAAFTMIGEKPPKPERPPSTSSALPPGGQEQVSGARIEAERKYALAYDEIAKAKKDLADGKAKNADKKFRRALERAQDAVALDSTYHEAWNMVGYASRKLGEYDRAFAAYGKCLSIKPDYAPAREYLGEAWLEKNDPSKAREQLAVLETMNPDSDESKALRGAVDAYATAHGEASTDSTAVRTQAK